MSMDPPVAVPVQLASVENSESTEPFHVRTAAFAVVASVNAPAVSTSDLKLNMSFSLRKVVVGYR